MIFFLRDRETTVITIRELRRRDRETELIKKHVFEFNVLMGLVPGTEKSAINHRQRFLQQNFDEEHLHPDVAESVRDFERFLQRLLLDNCNADADTAVGDADGPALGPVDPITHPLYDDV